jgi:transcriptional regulator with XRE-family HTH domain
MKTSGRDNLARLIKRLRLEKDLSLAQVESNSGGRITNGHLSRIENGHSENLTTDRLEAIADGLQVSPLKLCEALFGVTAPKDPNEEELILMYRSMTDAAKPFLLLIARAFRVYRADVLEHENIRGNVDEQIEKVKTKKKASK